jgi:hypothetical protein
MIESNSPSSFLGSGLPHVLAQIAKAVHEAVPFTRPEVVRLEGDAEGVRMQVGPSGYLLLTYAEGRWMCRDVHLDAETGEPDTSPLVQRLMRESHRPLPVSDPRDLSDVVHGFLRRAIAGWDVTAEHDSAQEHERKFAVEALSKSSQILNRRAPKKPQP